LAAAVFSALRAGLMPAGKGAAFALGECRGNKRMMTAPVITVGACCAHSYYHR